MFEMVKSPVVEFEVVGLRVCSSKSGLISESFEVIASSAQEI